MIKKGAHIMFRVDKELKDSFKQWCEEHKTTITDHLTSVMQTSVSKGKGLSAMMTDFKTSAETEFHSSQNPKP